MDPETIVLNITYVMYVSAPMIRDELRLRIFLALASVGFMVWAVLIESPWVLVWNGVFVLMSARNILRILRERRPVELPADQEQIRQRLFPEMTTRQFERFWELGEDHHAVDEVLTQRDEIVDHFWIFLGGDLRVGLTSEEVRMPANSTIGGMSYVMGNDVGATASVYAIDAQLRRWDKHVLRSLSTNEPELNAPFLSGIGRGLVSKIRS